MHWGLCIVLALLAGCAETPPPAPAAMEPAVTGTDPLDRAYRRAVRPE